MISTSVLNDISKECLETKHDRVSIATLYNNISHCSQLATQHHSFQCDLQSKSKKQVLYTIYVGKYVPYTVRQRILEGY